MNIEKRIVELLYFKDCVIVPGLGGFISQYVPARIKEETQTLIPPSKELGFNRDLLHDDGLLSGYLSACERVSPSFARASIDEFVDRLKVKMSSGEEAQLSSIGSLSYSKMGELVFSASREKNFLRDSYGLSSFHYIRPEQEQEHPLLRTVIFKPREKGRIIPLPAAQKEPERMQVIRRLAMAIPLLVVISMLPLNSRKNIRNGHQPATLFPTPSLSLVESGTNDPANNPSTVIFDSPKDLETVFKSEEDEISLDEPTPFDRSHFAIVAGSFSSEKNALVLKQELNDKGYSPEIWKANNGFFRVVIQAHEKMTKAQEAVTRLREDLSDLDFWILQ